MNALAALIEKHRTAEAVHEAEYEVLTDRHYQGQQSYTFANRDIIDHYEHIEEAHRAQGIALKAANKFEQMQFLLDASKNGYNLSIPIPKEH